MKSLIQVLFTTFRLELKKPKHSKIFLQLSSVVSINAAKDGGFGADRSFASTGRIEYHHASALPSPWMKAARAS
jgi:hypothetical protein